MVRIQSLTSMVPVVTRFNSGDLAPAAFVAWIVFASVLVIQSALLLMPFDVLRFRTELRDSMRSQAYWDVMRRRSFVGPAPAARPYGVGAFEAEELVAEWMRYLGAPESVVTQQRRDGGVDVRSRKFVAQVKNFRRDYVTVMQVRELYGVAVSEGRTALFFASGPYSNDAADFARRVGMPLFIFRAREGRLVAVNPLAEHIKRNGLHVPPPQGQAHPAPQTAAFSLANGGHRQSGS